MPLTPYSLDRLICWCQVMGIPRAKELARTGERHHERIERRHHAARGGGVSLFLLDLNGGGDDVSGNGIARLFLTIVSAFAESCLLCPLGRPDALADAVASARAPAPACARHRTPSRTAPRRPERMRKLRNDGLSLRKIAEQMAQDGIEISHVGVQRALAATNTREAA